MITEELIKKAQQGDSEAFTQIYDETIKTAYYVAKRILLNEQAVEDILQESYIAVYKNLDKYKSGNFQGWVDTIVANRSKNYLRKENPVLFSQMENEDYVNVEFEEEKVEFRPDEKVDYEETKRLIMEIVDNLSPEQRLATILFYFEQRSVKEIAEICECSENTVKSRLNYARKNIKEDVLELEKKGTKLYAIPVLPFLYWLFKAESISSQVPEYTRKAVVKAATEAIIGQNPGGVASVAVEKSTEEIVFAAGKMVEGSIPQVVGAATSKTGMTLGMKTLMGFVVAILTVGGVGITVSAFQNQDTIINTEGTQAYNAETEFISEMESIAATEVLTETENATETEKLTETENATETEKLLETEKPKESEKPAESEKTTESEKSSETQKEEDEVRDYGGTWDTEGTLAEYGFYTGRSLYTNEVFQTQIKVSKEALIQSDTTIADINDGLEDGRVWECKDDGQIWLMGAADGTIGVELYLYTEKCTTRYNWPASVLKKESAFLKSFASSNSGPSGSYGEIYSIKIGGNKFYGMEYISDPSTSLRQMIVVRKCGKEMLVYIFTNNDEITKDMIKEFIVY